MMLPTEDYRTTHITSPVKLHKGLDRMVHFTIGRYQRRSRLINSMHGEAEQIMQHSLKLRSESDEKLRARLRQLQSCYRRQRKGYEENLSPALALLAEIADRTLGLRPHPVQMLGAMALHQGYLAEMMTGEGKSLTACFPAVLAAWTGRPCHIITVNDYLAERDAHDMRPFYSFCNVSVGWVSSVMEPRERQINYDKGVVYTTSKEILADFLRDRLKLGAWHQPSRRLIRHMAKPWSREWEGLVMRGLDTAIVDEADSVLIDEAVTPLIISHPHENEQLLEACRIANRISASLTTPEDYRPDEKYHEIIVTKRGSRRIAELSSSLPGLWQGKARREELIIQALTAREFFHRNRQYVVQDGKVVIVDEFTGRLMPNRTWKHGLHQAVEAREGLDLSDPCETLARLSFQRFFRFFRKLSGMTGTAIESSGEFWHIYKLPVLAIPPHKPCLRKQFPDRVFSDQHEKWRAITEEILRLHKTGRPVLVGTRSVKASETLASLLSRPGLTFNLLNAVKHKEEASIVAKAGQPGVITIATNMAGRGTDIKLGQSVAETGGLHVIATERHESGRIDRQLFGRCARQGDSGSGQAFISLDDELFQRFVPASMRRLLSRALEKGAPSAQRIAECTLTYAQKTAQRIAYRQRRAVLHMDTWLEDALSFTGSTFDR